MYIVGFIKTTHPRVLINPIACASIDELYEHLWTLLNGEDFRQDPHITKEGLEDALQQKVPVRVNFAGFHTALLLGRDEVIYNATDRFVHADVTVK